MWWAKGATPAGLQQAQDRHQQQGHGDRHEERAAATRAVAEEEEHQPARRLAFLARTFLSRSRTSPLAATACSLARRASASLRSRVASARVARASTASFRASA